MKATFLFVTYFLSMIVTAGSNHFHPKKVAVCASECSADEIKAAVPEAISFLNKWNKIETSWKSANIVNIEQKQFKKGPEWVVTLEDATPSKQKRYVFMSLKGYVTGSNATGQ